MNAHDITTDQLLQVSGLLAHHQGAQNRTKELRNVFLHEAEEKILTMENLGSTSKCAMERVIGADWVPQYLSSQNTNRSNYCFLIP